MMKSIFQYLLISYSFWVISSLLYALPVHAYQGSVVAEEQQSCFAMAMVGMDSVINARLGVPPEHALELSAETHDTAMNIKTFDTQLLNTILNAYLWIESPHTYAVSVFYKCAQNQVKQQQASRDGENSPTVLR